MKIGFIGLGNMGAPMAVRLHRSNHQILGFDKAKIDIPGIRMVAKLPEVCQAVDVIITMLPNGEIVKDVWTTILNKIRPDYIVNIGDQNTLKSCRGKKLYEEFLIVNASRNPLKNV